MSDSSAPLAEPVPSAAETTVTETPNIGDFGCSHIDLSDHTIWSIRQHPEPALDVPAVPAAQEAHDDEDGNSPLFFNVPVVPTVQDAHSDEDGNSLSDEDNIPPLEEVTDSSDEEGAGSNETSVSRCVLVYQGLLYYPRPRVIHGGVVAPATNLSEGDDDLPDLIPLDSQDEPATDNPYHLIFVHIPPTMSLL
ncbi:hypothetical protein DFH07DRAFT_766794 [Mycena maculata]|uniref:Uncharacterized protein n=1 Tax=Mycena maculata TaxID=230809 RepID=A0AAD7NVD0_9AGAR|nr:hypothetical protein DFH07DRAFT_766794 [Mycena maculata]